MPGFCTHYLFGVDAYKAITSKSVKKNIYKNHSAYSLGLQGPDIFFYYLPTHIIHKVNLGDLAHKEKTGKFFSSLVDCRNLFAGNPKDEAIADAYITGFMGHYTLDCAIHPYVYAFTNYDPENPKKITEYFGQHTYFETELDNELLLNKKGITPSDFHQNSTIFLTPRQRYVIATLLCNAYRITYPDLKMLRLYTLGAPRWMKLGTRLLNDPSGQKKVMVRLLEKLILGNPFISPMVPSDKYQFVSDPLNLNHKKWTHPWTNEVHDESFNDLYQQAEKLFQKRISQYYSTLEQGLSEDSLRKLIKLYGNRSFLSGEPL